MTVYSWLLFVIESSFSLFSATLAANDGTVPAYSPRTMPSLRSVSLK